LHEAKRYAAIFSDRRVPAAAHATSSSRQPENALAGRRWMIVANAAPEDVARAAAW